MVGWVAVVAVAVAAGSASPFTKMVEDVMDRSADPCNNFWECKQAWG